MADPALPAGNYQSAVQIVKEGTIDIAKASWWGFDPNDATQYLQAAIDSGAKTLIVDDVGKPWIVRPIKLVSNQKIIFEPGVVVVAKRGEFKGRSDSLFTAESRENIELIGYGATLRMNRDDYMGPDYEKAEWRMVIALRSCNNVKIFGLTLAESGGDGIYLGVAKKGTPNRNIHIKDVVCDKNYRQGISVISAENLLIENVLITNTQGTAPQSGIDLEPNHADEKLVNITIRNCTTKANKGFGYQFHLVQLKRDSEPISIRVENCRSIADECGSTQITTGRTTEDAIRGFIEFVGCAFERGSNGGIGIDSNSEEAFRIRFVDCTLKNPALLNPKASPITISGAAQSIEFANLVVRDPLKRNPIHFTDSAGNLSPAIKGTIIVEDSGKHETIQISPGRE
ncbi:MAG: right-handed parallel beta-helix repeat-containing protein [Armatimonadota bacterium]